MIAAETLPDLQGSEAELDSAEFLGTREEWCEAIAKHILASYREIGIEMVRGPRQIRIAVAPLPASKLGVCYSSRKSKDGQTNLITIATQQADPLELVHTIGHELLHALDDCISGHKGRWARWAEQIGIAQTGHRRGPIAEQIFQSALRAVGAPAAHVATHERPRVQKKSQVRFICDSCSGYIHMPAAVVERGEFKVGCLGCKLPLLRVIQ